MNSSILRPALVAAAALAVTGCASDYGYRHHGYAGVSYGYARPYYGWYDNYYYPGTGVYVYDRSGARHRWNDRQRGHWETRRGHGHRRENWSGYNRDGHRDRDRHHHRR